MSGFTSPNFTQVPNDFFFMMQDMSEAEMKVTLALIRETFGYHRKACKLGITDLTTKTKMAEQSVRNGLSAAINRGTIHRLNPTGQGKAEWELYIDNTPQESVPPTEFYTPTPQQLDPYPPKFCTTVTVLNKEKESNKEKKPKSKKKGDYFQMMKDFQGGSEKAQQVEDVFNRLDKAFKTTFPRISSAEAVAKFILQREALGEKLDKFVAWAYRDEFNASRVWEYAENPSKIKTRWAHAFDKSVPGQSKPQKYAPDTSSGEYVG